MAEAPRKITIKLKPVGAKPATVVSKPAPAAAAPAPAPAPEAPVEPAPAPVAEAPMEPIPAPAAEVATPEVTLEPLTELEPIAAEAPAAPAPAPTAPKITLKKPLKVGVAPAAPAPEAAPATPPAEEAPAQLAKRQTSRIELPAEITQAPMSDSSEAQTIKLKPISETASEAPENPQAAKSKTARIELDAVLGGIQTNTPLANTTQKTIKLKRATPTAAPKPTASAPMSAVSAAPADAAEAPTLKLKRPGAPTLKKEAPKPAVAEPELEQLESLDDLDMTPLASMPTAPAEESTGAKIFTIIAVAAAAVAIIVTILLCGILQKHGASPDGSEPTGNTLHSLPFERLF